jgi:hypothetical protein
LVKAKVHASLGLARSGGRVRHTSLKIGSALLWPTGLVFLRKRGGVPGWAWAGAVLVFVSVFALGVYIQLATERLPIFLIGVPVIGVMFGLNWLYRRDMDLSTPEKVLEAATDPLSAFVPLASIESQELSKCVRTGWANPPALCIRYRDPDNQPRDITLAEVLASRVNFDPSLFQQKLTSCMKEPGMTPK